MERVTEKPRRSRKAREAESSACALQRRPTWPARLARSTISVSSAEPTPRSRCSAGTRTSNHGRRISSERGSPERKAMPTASPSCSAIRSTESISSARTSARISTVIASLEAALRVATQRCRSSCPTTGRISSGMAPDAIERPRTLQARRCRAVDRAAATGRKPAKGAVQVVATTCLVAIDAKGA